MTLFQAPLPPIPPQPPGSEMSVTGSLEGIAAVVLLLGVGLIVAALLWPLIRAIARRIEGGSAGAEVQAELEGLRDRVRQLEEMQPRMLELEERVDFAERIVAKGREPDRLER
jgi:hypothetical protein